MWLFAVAFSDQIVIIVARRAENAHGKAARMTERAATAELTRADQSSRAKGHQRLTTINSPEAPFIHTKITLRKRFFCLSGDSLDPHL